MLKGVLFQFFEWYSPADGSLWRDLAARAKELADLGITAVWMPPAYKGLGGGHDNGYGVYDLYDLGEFDQKGSVRTKYGTRDEFLAAVAAVRASGMQAIADVVFNHRMGADETEEVQAVEIHPDDRNQVVSEPTTVTAWTKFTFPGRQGKYSKFQWGWPHFVGFGVDDPQDGRHRLYRLKDKTFSGEVSFEKGNFDYLMGNDVDVYHPDVKQELLTWGKWFARTTQVDGFRLDAIKHIPASFLRDWFHALRSHFHSDELFGVGEYWSGDLEVLRKYLHDTQGCVTLFDVPLHKRMHDASVGGNRYDLRTIFDGTLVASAATKAVTFVENHDSQHGQSLQSPVDDWFKPLAYALILLRRDGYPCVFYGDYFGNPDPARKLPGHRKLIDDMLHARRKSMGGDQHDYLDHPNCVGWTWTGNDQPGTSLAVLMSNGDAGHKTMRTYRPNATYRDVTGHSNHPATTNDDGTADFTCPAGKVSVWVEV